MNTCTKVFHFTFSRVAIIVALIVLFLFFFYKQKENENMLVIKYNALAFTLVLGVDGRHLLYYNSEYKLFIYFTD